MKSVNTKWLLDLLKNGVIEVFDTSAGKYYRLVSSNIYIPEGILQLLKKEYKPNVEKGGFF